MLIDTHTHLDYEVFDGDRDAVVERARQAGVECVITIGTDLDSSHRALALADRYEGVYAVVGHHPTEAIRWTDNMAGEFEKLMSHPKVVGVGETGLDYYWKDSPPESQMHVFRHFIRLAHRHSRPLVIHVRDAYADVIEFLKSERPGETYVGVMHCFSGDEKFLEASLSLGFHLSLAGNITYKKSKLPDLVPKIPRDRILVETDCPFLPPVPHRGQRNEPAYVQLTARRLAEVLGETDDSVASLTSSNARRLFRL